MTNLDSILKSRDITLRTKSLSSQRLEMEMATYSSVLAWRVPWTEEPGGLQSMGSHRVGHDWGDLAAAATFLMVQLSHSYMTTGKIIALTLQTFVSKMMSLLFNILSRFVIAFHPRSKSLLILWLQSLSMVILEPKKRNSVTVFKFSLSICHEAMWPDSMIFVFWMLSFKPTFSLYPDMDSQYFSLLSG